MAREASKKPPHLAVSLDAKRNAELAAKSIGVDRGIIICGLLDVWEHVWRTKNDVVGEFILHGCFGQDAKILQALEAYGFIERRDGGWRVRGAEDWLFGSAERGSRGGRKTAEGGKSLRNLKQFQTEANAEAAPKQSRSTSEAHPPPTTQQPPPNSQQPPPPDGSVAVVGEVVEFPPTDNGCWRWMQQLRTTQGLGVETGPPRGFSEWHDRSLALYGPGAIAAAYERYLRDRHFADREWPTAVFITDGVFIPRISLRSVE